MANEVKFNPFNYRAITYLEFINQLNQNELFADKPQWLKVLLAGRADVLTSYIDARANNSLFHSMFTKDNVWNFAAYLGYAPNSAQPSSGNVTVTLAEGTTLPITIPYQDLTFSTTELFGGEAAAFQSEADVTFTALTQQIPVKEGEIISEQLFPNLQGTEFEEFTVSRQNLILGSASILFGAQQWTEVTNFADSTATDYHFKVILQEDGEVLIRGGDGVYGRVFPVGIDPILTARYGGGSRGNVGAGKIDVYSGTNTAIESVTNAARFTGGKGEESIESIKTYAPLSVISQDRIVSQSDFRYVSETYPGVAKAKIEPNQFGVGSTNIQIIPNGGGNPSTTLKNNLTSYLKEKTLLSNIFINVADPTYQSQDIEIEVQTGSGVAFSDVEDYVRLAATLSVSETTTEILEIFRSEGIVNFIEYINQIFSFTFSTTNNVVLQQIKDILQEVEARDWGQDLYEFDIFSLMKVINGVDFIELLTPADTVVVPDGTILTLGTLSVTSRNTPIRVSSDTLNITDSASATIIIDGQSSDTVQIQDNSGES